MIADGYDSEYRTVILLVVVISIEVIEFFPHSELSFCNIHIVSSWFVPACRSRFRMFLCRDILSSLGAGGGYYNIMSFIASGRAFGGVFGGAMREVK